MSPAILVFGNLQVAVTSSLSYEVRLDTWFINELQKDDIPTNSMQFTVHPGTHKFVTHLIILFLKSLSKALRLTLEIYFTIIITFACFLYVDDSMSIYS